VALALTEVKLLQPKTLAEPISNKEELVSNKVELTSNNKVEPISKLPEPDTTQPQLSTKEPESSLALTTSLKSEEPSTTT
jgi:hypothetical protein